jgi:hypothetical protein
VRHGSGHLLLKRTRSDQATVRFRWRVTFIRQASLAYRWRPLSHFLQPQGQRRDGLSLERLLRKVRTLLVENALPVISPRTSGGVAAGDPEQGRLRPSSFGQFEKELVTLVTLLLVLGEGKDDVISG